MDFREAAHYKAKYCTVVGFDSLLGKLGELIQKHGIKQIYLETEQLSVAQARRFEASFQKVGAEVVLDDTLDSAIRDQRMIKSPSSPPQIGDDQDDSGGSRHWDSLLMDFRYERPLLPGAARSPMLLYRHHPWSAAPLSGPEGVTERMSWPLRSDDFPERSKIEAG